MPFLSRRAVLAGVGAAVSASSGCVALGRSRRPAHEVSVYLMDRDEPHNVTVSVLSESEEILFKQDYRLSDSHQADEDGTFPASTSPETVRVIVDGIESVHPWPTFATHSRLPCGENSRTGLEVLINEVHEGPQGIETEANCQSTTME